MGEFCKNLYDFLADCVKCICSTIGNLISSIFGPNSPQPAVSSTHHNHRDDTVSYRDNNIIFSSVNAERPQLNPHRSSKTSSTHSNSGTIASLSSTNYRRRTSTPPPPPKRLKSPSIGSSDGNNMNDLLYYSDYSTNDSEIECVTSRKTPTPVSNSTTPLSSDVSSHLCDHDHASPSWQSSREAQEPLPSGVPKGLVNLGNTCYMNAVIQSLYSIDSFRNLILRTSQEGILTSGKSLSGFNNPNPTKLSLISIITNLIELNDY